MASESFLKAREKGRTAQKLLVEILKEMGVAAREVEDGYFPDYDIELETGKTIEVKSDFKAHLTGNILLELDAMDHSKADILALSYGVPIQCFYMLPMEKAREFAHQWPYKKNVGEFNGPAAIIKRQIFIELLKPEVINLNGQTQI